MATAKPIGAFSPTGAPGWISFGSIPSHAPDADLLAARDRSRATGFRWIVQLGFDCPATTPAGPVAAAARARLEALGLWPWVVALTWGEEWYERWYADEFAPLGLPASAPNGLAVIQDWSGHQHRAIQRATGKPVIWLTGLVHGPRAVPAGTDFVALDAYPPDGQTFAASVLPAYQMTAAATALPIVAIPRWFKSTGPFQGPLWHTSAREPSADAIAGYAAITAHPRVVAVWGFLWESRPYAELVGLADMPATAAAIATSLGVV